MEDCGFRIAQHFLGGIGLICCARDRGIGGVNQSPQQGLVADDLDVMLDARPVGYAVQKARHITHIPDRLQVFMPIKFLDQRDHVNRT